MYRKGIKGWTKHLDFIVLDVLCLQIALLIAYAIYYDGASAYVDPLYKLLAISLMFLDLVVIFFQEIYHNVLKRGYYKEFAKTVKQSFYILVSVVLFLFISQMSKEYSRIIMILTFTFYVPLRYVSTILLKLFIQKMTYKKGRSSLIILTNKNSAEAVIQNIESSSFGRYNIHGIIIFDEDMKGQSILDVPIVENIDKAAEYIGKEWIDEVLVASPKDIVCPQEIIDDIVETGVTLHQFLAKSSKSIGEKQFVEQMGKYSVLTTTINTMTVKQAFFKRVIDILGGLVGSILTILITIIIGPIIYISSPGPIFFSQTRIGQNGKKFKMYKFRSMYMDAEERKAELLKKNKIKDGMMFKLDFDPRVIGNKELPNGKKKTGIGQFIRDTSLDEFPQFFNVLIGNMSLVGVRPCLLDEWDKYELHHRTRAVVKPGITGMWQVSGRSEITDFEEVVKLDREYVDNWNLGLDIKILLKTIKVVLTKEGSM